MKFFVTVLMALTALTAVTADMDKYERMLKNWGKMKAMEGCFGEYNMKHWMLKMKAAKAKCSGMPAPELELDMFKGKVRTVNALISSGVTDKQNQFIDNMMREHFIKRLMRKQQMMELMGGDDEPDMPLLAKLRSRFARDADDEDMEMDNSLDLGDKMVQKLKNMEMAFTSDIGNMTCVLQECGVIDENMQIDVAAMDKFADEGKWAAEDNTDGVDRTWLHSKVKDIHQMCKDLSDAVPESILNSCEMPHYITKIIYFKKCKMFHKVEACMMSDVRHKISAHGMSVAELSEKAGQKEDTMTGLMAFVLFGKM